MSKKIHTHALILTMGLSGISTAAITVSGSNIEQQGSGTLGGSFSYSDSVLGALGSGSANSNVVGGSTATTSTPALGGHIDRVGTNRLRFELEDKILNTDPHLRNTMDENGEFDPSDPNFIRGEVTLNVTLPTGFNDLYLSHTGGAGFVSDQIIWSISWTGSSTTADISGNLTAPNTTDNAVGIWDANLGTLITNGSNTLTSGQEFRLDKDGVFDNIVGESSAVGAWRIDLPDGVTDITVTATAQDSVYSTSAFRLESFFLDFDEATVVPEPSTAIIISLFPIFSMIRRRR